jgi:hypothetical protein
MTTQDARDPVNHDLKTAEPFWTDVLTNRKHFEVRVNDRDYRVGDRLRLTSLESGKVCVRLVTYIVDGPPFLPPGLCVMGIVPVNDVQVGGLDE